MVNVAKIAVGVLLAVALALGVYGWMLARAPQAPDPQAQASAGNSQPNASLSVVVAAQAVPAGQALKAEDLQAHAVARQARWCFWRDSGSHWRRSCGGHSKGRTRTPRANGDWPGAQVVGGRACSRGQGR